MAEVLSYVQYNKEDLISRVRRAVEAALREKRLTHGRVGPLHEALRGGPRGLHVPLARRLDGPAPRGREAPPWPKRLPRLPSPGRPASRCRSSAAPCTRAATPSWWPRCPRPAGSASCSRSRSPTSTATTSARGCASSGGSPRKPIGMNALIEQSSKAYHERMVQLGRHRARGGRPLLRHLARQPALGGGPRAHAVGGVVYHDVTERKWAEKGLAGGVRRPDRASTTGPAATRAARAPRQLLDELGPLGVPVVCAGGIGDEADFVAALAHGLRRRAARHALHRHHRVPRQRGLQAGDRRGRRGGHRPHRADHRRAGGGDQHAVRPARWARKAGPLARWMLRGRRTKHWMRTIYALRSLWQLKRGLLTTTRPSGDYWQAGKSVAGIDRDRARRRDRAPLRRGLAGVACGLSRFGAGGNRPLPVRATLTRAPVEPHRRVAPLPDGFGGGRVGQRESTRRPRLRSSAHDVASGGIARSACINHS